MAPAFQPLTPSVSLDAAGLVALADLTTIQERTALTGTSVLLDTLIICPGLHMQRKSPSLNSAEYPACAALTTGYVFRIENPAMVYYLQLVGKTGKLTTLTVSEPLRGKSWYRRLLNTLFLLHNATPVSTIAYGAAVAWTVTVVILLGLSEDWWGLMVIFLLMLARLGNVLVIRRRSAPGWAGAPEPTVRGDLLVLLSQDRWIRIKGTVDDLKQVTSGQWLRDETRVESWITAVATVVVYLAAALASNIQQLGKILLLALLIGSAGLLAVTNVATKNLHMHGRVVKVQGKRRPYGRRLDLANALIEETGRDDWAIRLGMIVKNDPQGSPVQATM